MSTAQHGQPASPNLRLIPGGAGEKVADSRVKHLGMKALAAFGIVGAIAVPAYFGKDLIAGSPDSAATGDQAAQTANPWPKGVEPTRGIEAGTTFDSMARDELEAQGLPASNVAVAAEASAIQAKNLNLQATQLPIGARANMPLRTGNIPGTADNADQLNIAK